MAKEKNKIQEALDTYRKYGKAYLAEKDKNFDFSKVDKKPIEDSNLEPILLSLVCLFAYNRR